MKLEETSETEGQNNMDKRRGCSRGTRRQLFLEGMALRLGAESPRDRSQSLYHLQAQAASSFGVRADELAQPDGEKRNIR